jgi:hypothetical protein
VNERCRSEAAHKPPDSEQRFAGSASSLSPSQDDMVLIDNLLARLGIGNSLEDLIGADWCDFADLLPKDDWSSATIASLSRSIAFPPKFGDDSSAIVIQQHQATGFIPDPPRGTSDPESTSTVSQTTSLVTSSFSSVSPPKTSCKSKQSQSASSAAKKGAPPSKRTVSERSNVDAAADDPGFDPDNDNNDDDDEYQAKRVPKRESEKERETKQDQRERVRIIPDSHGDFLCL